MKNIEGEFRDFIHSQLVILDAMLIEANEPVHGRPMRASMLFVTECIVSINDEEIDDDFLLQDYFGDILAVTTQWYRIRYGSELLKTPSDNIHGVVAAFGTPLSLQIPRIPEFGTPKTAVKRMVFADGVLDEENPMEWVTPAPDFGDFKTEATRALREDVTRVSSALRQVYRRILVADFSSSEERNLASSVEGHLEKSAADIESSRYGAAVWEIHLCVEKILKVFLRQTGAYVPHSHDVSKLVTAAEEAGLPSCGHLNLHQLPPDGDAIRHRYEELPSPTFKEIMEIYDVAIHVTAHVAGALKQSSFAENKEFYIKALPWHPKWKKNQSENIDE
tara:strand:- start:26453 stop:27454 length:1002 start_codon:yes stop_codon:yes gene_type:complete